MNGPISGIVFLLIVLNCNSQSDTTHCKLKVHPETKRNYYVNPEKGPAYENGSTELLQAYIHNNINLSKEAHKIKEKLILEFIVDAKGKLKFTKSYMPWADKKAEQEIIRVIEGMKGWKPGMCNGKPVPCLTLILFKNYSG